MVNQYAILHEGNINKKSSDHSFIKLLIDHLGFDASLVNFYGMSRKSNFFKPQCEQYGELPRLLQVGTIKKALFIIDADFIEADAIYGGYENTNNEIIKILHELKIHAYSSISISCDPKTKTGYLESLILTTIPIEHKACVETFLKCSDFKSKDNAKAILNQIYRQAYPNAPYDFSHENFDELKSKLIALFTKE